MCINISLQAIKKQLLSGNKCGHNRLSPLSFVPPTEHKTRWDVLRRTSHNLSLMYFNPSKWLKDLQLLNPSNRQRRSERREAIMLISQTIVHYTDLVDLHVGIPQSDGSFRALTAAFLAKRAGIGLKRAKRALSDLRKAGYLKVIPRCKRGSDGSIKGLAAIREVTLKFFKHLGIAYQTLRKKQEQAKSRFFEKVSFYQFKKYKIKNVAPLTDKKAKFTERIALLKAILNQKT